ncbi:C40 family peptidase [Roseovarius indicus]|uniref:Gamma-D-glutamyl-L-lysine endopeptidase n=1 Tax=Roseovarius indicus TaxID=540747 RepID=A0A0T5PF31_9RHOB|nr:NlpC/P60 family protein [Roseovarius indicus]KRS19831.1 NLP/P60 hydrolase [Roseovarius indicus]QEW28802.1 Gamma-D-glutamyl-L-lysine endopeptidase [Roseovarius indicus]SFD84144.1 Cell wall-associated hydrolase, NlpC family [Roseovarius indicus]
MTDPRRHPANGRVAALRLQGKVEAATFVEGTTRRVVVPVADLLREPGGARDRQLLLGDAVAIYEEREGWAFAEAEKDGYTGYVRADQLSDVPAPTHRVTARATHLYRSPDFKTRELAALSHGALLTVTGQEGRFAATSQGFVPSVHLSPVEEMGQDPVDVAEVFLGTPYLWGGNTSYGIDCSGLVQMACLACGIECPGDSDMQEAELGQALPEDAPLQRGDLLFWKTHVAWVANRDTLLHANANSMATSFEPLEAAVNRIEAQGDGPVTSRKRLGEF